MTNLEITSLPDDHRKSDRRRKQVNAILVHVALIGICACALMPFLYMLSTSFKTTANAASDPPQLLPIPFQPQNYHTVLTDQKNNFLLWARNSMMITMLSVLGTLLSSSLVAYGFAKIRFRGRKALFVLMLATMMIPFPVTMVSLFSIWGWLGNHTGIAFLGTFKPLWLPTWFGSAFCIFLLRQFFITIPKELSEAARIDGCSELGIFLRIVIPLSRPALTVVALFAFMWSWKDFLAPLVYLQRSEQFTLALGLQNFQSQQNGLAWELLMAASVLVILPVILVFFIAQKTFIQGISTTGLKG